MPKGQAALKKESFLKSEEVADPAKALLCYLIASVIILRTERPFFTQTTKGLFYWRIVSFDFVIRETKPCHSIEYYL
jgi:hypothetical protein